MEKISIIKFNTPIRDSIFRPLGAGFAMAIPLFLGLLFKDLKIASLGVMGAFSYLAFQFHSISYNLKAIAIHGLCLATAFSLGMGSARLPWTIPFIMSALSFTGFMFTKILQIPKPDYFFMVMLYATGTNMNSSASGILISCSYLLYGIVSSLVAGLLVSSIERLPWKKGKEPYQQLSLKDKYYVLIYQQPEVILKAFSFATILFIAAYVSLILKNYNGYWVLISSAAVLSGEHMEKIKQRSVQRIVGSVIGLLLGFFFLQLRLSLIPTIGLLIILNILVEFFMPRNYAIANFFTNPQVLLLSTLASHSLHLNLVSYRFSGIIIGSILAIVLMILVDYGLSLSHRTY